VIPLARLPAFLDGREALPQRSVVITIDDGYESTYSHALPALRRHGFPATVFVYTDFVGAGDALSWAQLRELVASGLFEIGAHSKTHRNLTERSARETEVQYRREIDNELRASRALLEKQLGIRVRFFAMPFGDANGWVIDALERQDYKLAATVTPGGNAFFGDRLMLRRTMVMGDHDLAAFRQTLQISRATGAR
jgi:peptidoglycan/xylan/chitin deacetylase (PgdA/CDA1 family)